MPSPWLSPLRQPPRFASCSPQTLFCVCRCRSCSRSARSHSYSKDSRVKEMSVIEMSRAIVRKNVVIEGESAAHERYVRARVRKQKRPSTLIATITIRGVRVQTLIARFFSTTAKTLITKGEEVIQSRERERKNSINNNKRERETSSKRFKRLSLFFLRTDTTALTDFFGAVVLETTRTPVNWVVVSANIFYSRRVMMMIMKR